MALFKVLRGSSSALDSQPFVDGYAYFTPDDGRFYIDVKTDTAPNYYYSSGTVDGHTIYRIELESGTWAALNNTKISVGDTIDFADIVNVHPLRLVAGTTTYVYDGTVTLTFDTQSDWAETNTTSTTYIKNKPTIINTAITIDDGAKTMFITSPIENGDEVSY